MAPLVNRTGIEVEIPPETGCGNPCHPGHTCSSCEPFWHMMLSTGRFQAYVPPTFGGAAGAGSGAPANKPNFSGRKMEFADLKFRSRGSDS
jgi:hypothetical protein